MRPTRAVTRAFCLRRKRPAISVLASPSSVRSHPPEGIRTDLPREPLLLVALRHVDICKGASVSRSLRNPSRYQAHLRAVNICHGASGAKVSAMYVHVFANAIAARDFFGLWKRKIE